MTVSELKSALAEHPGKPVTFVLPDGEQVPAHFHVTEVGFAKKEFIDCGGTVRTEGKCLLQIWVDSDIDHRVDSDKLGQILIHGKPVIPTEALPVEIEYNHPHLSHFPLERAEDSGDGLVLQLVNKHTDCLAKDVCGIPTDGKDACCTPGSGCC